ncbi:hypothetical protein LMG28688_04217 [Paraburkholderia caffeinitolerans]|uniref:DUF6602 domain-containing protein n=1 Tax=Paraburkholderia caffeinitolerans TaxID=1723730 RepID=A0A6J5GFP2_9BURK|nr:MULTISPECIES: DUF6602 domain-containing protein [Paraburkholderia]CAB3796017.1 hypothetical protein LMG28688_04217 [Paraburkholderia caffeinitolerans]
MADKNLYQTLLRSKVRGAILAAEGANAFSHQVVKGTVLEILISELFRPLLPADIGIGTGQIIESYSGKLSGQIDIVLYDKAILPPILIDEKLGLFPIESVLYAIEVKTTLTAAELQSAHDSAKDLQTKFGYLPGQRVNGKLVPQHSIEKARNVIFALKSDLSGTKLNEAERYKKIYGDEPAHIASICVAGREYWFQSNSAWVGGTDTDQFDGILSFIGGVTNTYRGVSASRGYPLLGHYVVAENMHQFPFLQVSKDLMLVVQCPDCKCEILVAPELPPGKVTFTGTISTPCKCGAMVKAPQAQYEFQDSKLVSVLPHPDSQSQ